jgi:hypothetical protein
VPFLPSELTLTTEGLAFSATCAMALEKLSRIPTDSDFVVLLICF